MLPTDLLKRTVRESLSGRKTTISKKFGTSGMKKEQKS
jgi:hypothetical protein